MTGIVESLLFQTVSPRLRSITPEQFFKELKKVQKAKVNLRLNTRSIDSAMAWRDTPQGANFWEKLSEETS
jgi:hypothetical protein